MKNKITLLFDLESAEFILNCFSGFEKTCIACRKEITVKNIGVITKNGLICKKLGCHLSHLYMTNPTPIPVEERIKEIIKI